MNVIKEYLNPDFQKKKTKQQKKSTNELMMGEIRNFMDTANAAFLKRKEIEKEIELQEVGENIKLEIKPATPRRRRIMRI